MKYLLLLLLPAYLLIACSPPAPPRQFPYFRQTLNYDCAPSCLKMIYAYYGEEYPETELMRRLKTDSTGTTLQAMYDLSNQLGFTTMLVSVNMDFLTENIKLPCIVDWNGNHVVVVYKVDSTHIYVADPADTFHVYDKQAFMTSWLHSNSENKGIALVVYKL
ncbi:cysteine peptidase family C39 domain-containing protein [Taibaiella koreensis]|uniref:cysteine peptidase family C39 domain-containing protein n=1 Tax=Taibaiella koreensis TaxID=1268548 RepID=UPI000E59AFF9|nr:cysteine peptidase family C39 domain-containing protein [Taibaiella koreensis]